MKKLFIILFLPFIIKGQELHTLVFANSSKSFLGKTKEQIETYWSDKVSDEYFKFLSSGPNDEKDFIIMEGNVGQAEFSATIKDDKCISQTVKLLNKDISVFVARISKLGFTYKKSEDAYINSQLKLKWRIEHLGANSSNINEAYLSKL